MEEVQVGNASIIHQNFIISKFVLEDLNVGQLIAKGPYSSSISFNPGRPDQCEVRLPEGYDTLLEKTFDVISTLYSNDNGCLAAYLSSYIFESMIPYWKCLLHNGKHILAIQFWRKVISITHEWERKTGKHIHKGSPYAFIAMTYLIIGDVDTGFSFIYNAIDDDIELNKVCPQLNYPADAPVYLTASISSNIHNIMAPLVNEIRSKLSNYIESYNQEFGKSFTMDDLDNLFLQNSNLDTLKYFFVFNVWSIFEYQRKVNQNLMQNDFSKLKNSNWLFGLCLVIDKLLHNLPKYCDRYLGTEIINLIDKKKWMTKADINKLIKNEKIQNDDPDNVIPKLLTPFQYQGNYVQKEIKYLLIAWNLRNFAGHNVHLQDVIVREFENILKILIYDILLILEEYR